MKKSTQKKQPANPVSRRSKQATPTTTTTTNSAPQMRKSVNIKHEEMLCSLEYSSEETPVIPISLTINPGDASCFPWLSQIAQNFEYYRFRSLKIRYVPRCSMLKSGSVVMAIDYDVSDAEPVHLEDLALYLGRISFAVYDKAIMVADPRSLNLYPYRYLRSTGTDPRLESVGCLYVGLSTSDVATFGDFYIDYDIDLFCPQFAEPAGAVRTAQANYSGTTTTPLPGVNTNRYLKNTSFVANSTDSVDFIPKSDGKYLLSYTSPLSLLEPGPGILELDDPHSIVRAAKLLNVLAGPNWTTAQNGMVESVQALLDLAPSTSDTDLSHIKLKFDTAMQFLPSELQSVLSIMKIGDSFANFGTTWSPGPSSSGVGQRFVVDFKKLLEPNPSGTKNNNSSHTNTSLSLQTMQEVKPTSRYLAH